MKKLIITVALILATLMEASTATPQVLPARIINEYQEYKCLVTTLWHEARSESIKGIRYVAAVVLNRTDHKAYPDTICQVVLQPHQFTDVQESFKRDIKRFDSAGYTKVSTVAYNALYGDLRLPEGILWYHTTAVKPNWSKRLKKYAKIGSHVFYRY